MRHGVRAKVCVNECAGVRILKEVDVGWWGAVMCSNTTLSRCVSKHDPAYVVVCDS